MQKPNRILLISDGTINNCEFTEVPYLRFRKQLQNNIESDLLKDLKNTEIARAKENSVFIVNSQQIKKFLDGLDFGKNYTLRK